MRFLTVALALWSTTALAQEHPVFGDAPEVTRLPNGMNVVSVRWNTPGIIAYYTLVRVGSRDEVEDGHSGFAHLFEHMMFRGTEAMPGPEYERRIQSFGADNNAYTTRDFTLYTVTAPSSVLEELMTVEAERFQRLSYTEDAFRTETGAVQGEYAKNASNPNFSMWEALSEISFPRHTYGHTTMGYLRDICRMPTRYEYSRRFFRRFYTPDNTTLIVVGDVDHAALVRLARTHYGRWRGRRDNPRIPRAAEPTEGARRHLPWDGASAPRFFVGYRTPAFDGGHRRGPRRRAALRVSAALEIAKGLAFAESAPLYQRLVVQDQTLLTLGSWNRDFHRDSALVVINGQLKPTESAPAFDAVLEAIQTELSQIAEGNTPAERIEAVRSNLRYGLLGSLRTPDDVANLLGNFAAAGGSVASLDEYLAALAAVTPDDVAQAARQYLTPSRRFIVTLAPRTEADGPVPEPGNPCEALLTEGNQ
ncbi:MAG: pitrilysin family protein [Myxococcota bacterium]